MGLPDHRQTIKSLILHGISDSSAMLPAPLKDAEQPSVGSPQTSDVDVRNSVMVSGAEQDLLASMQAHVAHPEKGDATLMDDLDIFDHGTVSLSKSDVGADEIHTDDDGSDSDPTPTPTTILGCPQSSTDSIILESMTLPNPTSLINNPNMREFSRFNFSVPSPVVNNPIPVPSREGILAAAKNFLAGISPWKSKKPDPQVHPHVEESANILPVGHLT